MATQAGSVSAGEVARFGALAPRWWDSSGPMRELHRMNPLRTRWVMERSPIPAGATLLDVGCGGGIATEVFARAGFAVTGLDASAEAVGVARAHAAADGLDIAYRVGLAEDLLAEELRFDVIAAFEVIEHVPDQPAFIATLAALLAPGGKLFISTLNRTLRSLALAKIGAEYVARLLPVGTHDWNVFVKPQELAQMARSAGLCATDVSGMMIFPGRGWVVSRDVGVNYLAVLVGSTPP